MHQITKSLFVVLVSLLIPFITIMESKGQNPITPAGTDTFTLSPLEIMSKQEEQIVLLRNKNNIIPILSLDKGKFALVVIGDAPVFTRRVMDYLEMPVLNIPEDSIEVAKTMLAKTSEFDRIIIVIANSFISEDNKKLILNNSAGKDKIIVFLGAPDELKDWTGIENSHALLFADNKSVLAQDLSAQIIFGGIGASGKLNQPVSEMFYTGDGLVSEGGLRMKYTIPEEEGINSKRLESRIDSIVELAIANKAFPGCQVLMALNGKVLFNRSYGYHTYTQRNKVTDTDLYDLASVSKICGALPLLMQMDGQNLIDLDKPFSSYWTDWKKSLFHHSNKDTLTLRQLLTHQGRLNPYLPFWRESMKGDKYNTKLYRNEKTEGYSLEIDDHLFLTDKFRTNVYRAIRKSDLMPKVEYKYSCLSFIIYPGMISKVTGKDYEQLLYSSVYRPLGATRLTYNPLQKGFGKEEIPPTEEDIYFRKDLVHGRVHDEAAAALGGISGNAGIFANANDLAKLMHLYLNNGIYGGEQLIPREIMEEYNQPQFPNNRRAIGFDKPLPYNASKSLDEAWPAPGASQQSFGHSGFTGTFVWVDPVYNIVYIFLSNRVYPTRSHNAISKFNVRLAIQQVLYDEINFRDNIKLSE